MLDVAIVPVILPHTAITASERLLQAGYVLRYRLPQYSIFRFLGPALDPLIYLTLLTNVM